MSDVENQIVTNNVKTKRGRLFLRTFFHSVYLLLDVCCSLYAAVVMLPKANRDDMDQYVKDLKNWSAAFFTNWNFTFQISFLSLALLYDVLEWLDHNWSQFGKRVKYWRDIIFCGMIVPCTVFVSSMFWTVYAIDRELVFPKVFDAVVPWWFNQCVHTNVFIMVILETLLQARPHPTNRLIEEFLYWFIVIGYAVVFYTIHFMTNRWLYKVFGIMTWWQVCLYQLYIWLSMYAVYKVQFPINRLIHGSESEHGEINKESNNGGDINKENISGGETNKAIVDEEDTSKEGDGRWSMKFRNNKNGVEGTRL